VRASELSPDPIKRVKWLRGVLEAQIGGSPASFGFDDL
jgi:hypothetical protein